MLKKIKTDIKKHKMIYLMAVPVLLFYIIFCYVPMGGLIMAFQNYRPSQGITGSAWCGLKHFIDFFHDMNFGRLMRNTFLLNVYDIIVGFPAPIILALLLNELRGKFLKGGIQTMIYMPNFISIIVLCGMILDFCSTEGVVNSILSLFGIAASNLLQNPALFKPIFIITNL